MQFFDLIFYPIDDVNSGAEKSAKRMREKHHPRTSINIDDKTIKYEFKSKQY